MPTLLLRLQGPMQSWGTQSRFLIRDTGLEPSKSGVIGLLCAALGKPREERTVDTERWPSLVRLSELPMAVRVDRPGVVQLDYHTAGGSRRENSGYGVAKADGSAPGTVVSQRYFLADAAFLVGLESNDPDLLQRLHAALAAPRWPLYLGRKSFVPGAPVFLADGLRPEPLLDALKAYPPLDPADLGEEEAGERQRRVRVVMDVPPDHAEVTQIRVDVPVSFVTRQFSLRRVAVTEIELLRHEMED